MKAYEISYFTYEYGNLTKIVWAETAGKAKSQGVHDDELGDPSFTDLSAVRIKWADDMQSLDDNQLFLERVKHGRYFYRDSSGDSIISDETLPLIEKVGGIDRFDKLYDAGKIIWNDDTYEFEEI